MGRPDKAARAAIARRRSDAIDLRLAGVDWLTIARKLAADPAVNSDGIAYPQGYVIERYRKKQDPPSDEALIHAACRDVRTALADRRAELNDDVDELRALEADRLDRLFFVAYKKAVRDHDLAAVDRMLRIMERAAHGSSTSTCPSAPSCPARTADRSRSRTPRWTSWRS
ncbi:hypothetical protein [Streptomyces sp. NPDC056527]|uniref:hypothetical protein n=1 Tax=Streptomyces sp. NPDC056527 TaxID=3345853 RepID=UPI0036A415D6